MLDTQDVVAAPVDPPLSLGSTDIYLPVPRSAFGSDKTAPITLAISCDSRVVGGVVTGEHSATAVDFRPLSHQVYQAPAPGS
jgi:hypothetical protein